MDNKKDALQHAGEQIDQQPEALMELGKWVGRGQAFGMIGARANAAQAQVLKRIKDGGEYKVLNLTWDQFCDREIGVSRATVDRIIANFEEFGASYFSLSTVMRISPTTYRLIAGAVDESTVEIDGEKIAITKNNASRIAEAVASLRKSIEQKDESIATKRREADKLREERNSATKAAEKVRQEFVEYKKQQAQRWPNADEDHNLMLDAQSLFDLAMAKLTAAGNKELSDDNQARFIGLAEYMYRSLIQTTYGPRERMGKGWNMADPIDMMSLDQVSAGARNLVTEITEDSKRRGK